MKKNIKKEMKNVQVSLYFLGTLKTMKIENSKILHFGSPRKSKIFDDFQAFKFLGEVI